VFCSENEDEDDYYCEEEEEEEYWRINKHNRKLSVFPMKTEKCQNTAQGCTETFGRFWTAAAAGNRWRFQRQLNPSTPMADTTKKMVVVWPRLCRSFEIVLCWKSCAGQQGHRNLNSKMEFELKLIFKLDYAMW